MMQRRWLQMTWWSGAVGILAALHVGRAVAGVPVSIGRSAIPIWLSAAIGVVAGGAAIGLYWAGARQASRAARRRRGLPGAPTAPASRAADASHAEACGGLHAAVAADDVDDEDE
jgi:hypothetical protein